MDIRPVISTNPYLNKYASRLKDSSMPVINFTDYLVEQGAFSSKEELRQYIRDTSVSYDDEKNTENSASSQIVEVKGKKYILGDVQIADFSQLYEFYPTGDHEKDYQIQMGINYNKTCYDGTNCRDYDKLTAAEDFTGMSAAEIYKAIYEKYQHCYGENFIDINAVPYVAPPYSEDSFSQFIDKFYNELEAAVGGTSERQKARREALYGDMSDYDVRAAIMEKYADGGALTNADLYKITAEMDRCGVGGGIHNSLIFVQTKDRSQVLYNSSLGIKTSVEEACTMHEQMLASPLNAYMVNSIEAHRKGMGTVSPEFYSALSQLREACGAHSGGWVSLENANNISVSQTSRGVRL